MHRRVHGRPYSRFGVPIEPGRDLRACPASAALPLPGPDGQFHRFTPPLPRERTLDGVCDVCDSTGHAHAGPVVSRGYPHRLRPVAEAFVAVGRGVSYTRAGQRARVAAGRDPTAGDSAGQMVDAWAPTIVAAYAETDWPETLVLDSTDFWWTNARTNTRRRDFAIQVAYGGHRPADWPHLGHLRLSDRSSTRLGQVPDGPGPARPSRECRGR
jgi:hypothetical protein